MIPVEILAETAVTTQVLPQRLDELTAARGIAASLVVLFHINAYSQGLLASWFSPIAYGTLAVDFFFVLSGFVLTHVYRDAWHAGTYRHANFLVKRFARLWPLHMASLAGIAVLVFAGARIGIVPPWDPTLGSFLLNASMLHATGLATELAWNQPSWSVSAEWCAYLVFPVFLIASHALRRSLPRIAAALAVFAVCYAVSGAVLHEDLMSLTTGYGVLRILPSFFAGVVLRSVLDDIVQFPWARNPAALNALLLATAATMAGAAVVGVPNIVFWPLIVLAILLLALRARCPAHGVLRARPITWLGDISYALYLVHAPVLMIVFGVGAKLLDVTSPLGLAGIGAIGFVTAVATAHVAHMLIERPAQRWIVGLSRRRAPALA